MHLSQVSFAFNFIKYRVWTSLDLFDQFHTILNHYIQNLGWGHSRPASNSENVR